MTEAQPIYTRNSPVAYRRLSATELRRIADTIADEFEAADKSRAALSISITYDDETSYEIKNARLPPTDDAFSKSIDSFNIRCILPYDRRISLDLSHGDAQSAPFNSLVVSAPDLTWVNGLTGRVSDLIAAGHKQPRRKWLIPIAAIGIGMAYSAAFTWLIAPRYVVFGPGDPAPWILFVGLAFILSGVAAGTLDNLGRKMWPVVELQSGPTHAQTPARLRNRVFFISLGIVFPIFVAFLPNLLLPSPQMRLASGTATQADVPPGSTPTVESNPLEVMAIAQRPRVKRGETEPVSVRVRNRGNSMIPEVRLQLDAGGFNVEDFLRRLRFLGSQQDQTQEFDIPIDQGVPPGEYEASVSASMPWSSESHRFEASARVRFTVE